jgi:hypothetical protein
MSEFAKGGIIPSGLTVAVNSTRRPEIVLDTAEFDATLATVTAKLDRLDAIGNARAWEDDEAASDWICGRCERGQCARCRDETCTCCNGNPEDEPRW